MAVVRITPAVLAAMQVLYEAGETFGWKIIDRTGKQSGTIYPILARLEGAGWVTSRWEQLSDDVSRPRQRRYKLTAAGIRELQKAEATTPALSAGVFAQAVARRTQARPAR